MHVNRAVFILEQSVGGKECQIMGQPLYNIGLVGRKYVLMVSGPVRPCADPESFVRGSKFDHV